MEELVESTLNEAGVIKRSGHHSNTHVHNMFHTLFTEIHSNSKNFQKESGRKLDAFKKFNNDIFNKMNKVSLVKWMKRLTNKWHNGDFSYNPETDD